MNPSPAAQGQECAMLYCAQPAEAESDYCPAHRHGVYREHDETAASGRTNDAFDEKGCIVSRPEDFSAATTDPRLVDAYRRDRVLELVDVELGRALAKFDSFNSPHEGWAVIREELDELWEHVKDNTGREALARTEAIQVAAMALRYVLDLSLEGPWAR